jgi:hypothetical protein
LRCQSVFAILQEPNAKLSRVPDERFRRSGQPERRAVEIGARLRQTTDVPIPWLIRGESASHPTETATIFF